MKILYNALMIEIQKTKGKVILASATVELIKVPELKIDVKK